MIFFPELQLTPFFPQYEKRDAEAWAMALDGPEITVIRDACRRLGLFASPNVYLTLAGHRYDASLMIDSEGNLLGISKMVHIAQAEHFYEQDYYTDAKLIAELSADLGEAMVGINENEIALLMAERGK